jgi:tRNA (cmo5U34)-methyltransferase
MGYMSEYRLPQLKAVSRIDKNSFFFVKDDNYDEYAELAIPYYREMHNELTTFGPSDPLAQFRVLDLGVGTGKTSEVFLDKYPQATVVGIDLFDEMLDHARSRFAKYGSRVQLEKGDFRTVALSGQFDVCVSALSLHHLTPSEKKELFQRIRDVLKPQGLFLMIDWTRFQSPRIQKAAFENAEKHVRAAVSDTDIINNWCQHWKYQNIPDCVEEMLSWLKTSGFGHAECIIRHYGIALIVAEVGGSE